MQHQWWHNRTAYQIYPKSFMDSNGDGIGDLRGVISKLDYLKELGIGILWLSPIYCSPLADEGYDISDYYNIDSRFGTMDDLRELLREAAARGIAVLMDLVVNHCSDEHEWFQKACADPDGPYGRYFYILDHKEGEPLPCNWRSYFGGSVWEPLPGHPDKVYLHLFHKKQPDLNWENPELRREIYTMINWWLDQGLSGFRIDAIINIKKRLPFCDYPPDREDGLCSVNRELEEATGVTELLQEMADSCFHPHQAFTIAELFNQKESDAQKMLGDGGCFSTIFEFGPAILGQSEAGWHKNTPVTLQQYKAAVLESQVKMQRQGFYYANIIENHDEPRGVSHFLPKEAQNDRGKKMLAGLMFNLRGLPFLYQGQEIGMENTAVTDASEIEDCSAVDQYNVCLSAGLEPQQAIDVVNRYSRDNARTPMQWSAEKNAGFSTGTSWLPANRNYTRCNVEAMRSDPDSLLSFYQKMIAFRSSGVYSQTLTEGAFAPYQPEIGELMAYMRTGDRRLLIAANITSEPALLPLKDDVQCILLNNAETPALIDGGLRLSGFQFVMLELKGLSE